MSRKKTNIKIGTTYTIDKFYTRKIVDKLFDIIEIKCEPVKVVVTGMRNMKRFSYSANDKNFPFRDVTYYKFVEVRTGYMNQPLLVKEEQLTDDKKVEYEVPIVGKLPVLLDKDLQFKHVQKPKIKQVNYRNIQSEKHQEIYKTNISDNDFEELLDIKHRKPHKVRRDYIVLLDSLYNSKVIPFGLYQDFLRILVPDQYTIESTIVWWVNTLKTRKKYFSNPVIYASAYNIIFGSEL